jgi:hypothetical protein
MTKKTKRGYTVDKVNGEKPIYFGIKKKALHKYELLQDGMANAKNWPCKDNPYYYQDYDGYGFEDPDGKGDARPLTEDECEQLCTDCPLLKLCYDFAVANEEQHGVWGGINFTKTIDKK